MVSGSYVRVGKKSKAIGFEYVFKMRILCGKFLSGRVRHFYVKYFVCTAKLRRIFVKTNLHYCLLRENVLK